MGKSKSKVKSAGNKPKESKQPKVVTKKTGKKK